MKKIQFKLTAWTDQGLVRTNNEDNFVVNPDLSNDAWFCPQDSSAETALSEAGCLLVVADGMGGMNAGEEASKTAVEVVKELFQTEKLPIEESQIEPYMKSVVTEADKRIKAKGKDNPTFAGMGTTLVICWIRYNKAHIAWCGDSRAYSFHPKTGLRRLSKDHSYVQELVDKGELTQELAFEHPDSNIITRSLGDPSKAAQAECVTSELHNGELFMLCSDGLCGLLRDNETEAILAKNTTDLAACRDALIKGALDAGGYDNVTVALCQIISGATEMPKEMQKVEADIPLQTTQPIKKPKKKRAYPLYILIAIILIICGIIMFCRRDKNTSKEPPKTETPSDSTKVEVKESPKQIKKDNRQQKSSRKDKSISAPDTSKQENNSDNITRGDSSLNI